MLVKFMYHNESKPCSTGTVSGSHTRPPSQAPDEAITVLTFVEVRTRNRKDKKIWVRILWPQKRETFESLINTGVRSGERSGARGCTEEKEAKGEKK